jgi:CheY-like chemotaxis protein
MGIALRPRLLVVDDDEDLQRAVKRVAEAAGYEVLQEFDGAELQSLVKETTPDVVLLDVDMPNSDGRDVLRRLKNDPATSAVPVIMCSSRVDELDSRSKLQLGADGYVAKPSPPHVLLATIARALTARGS